MASSEGCQLRVGAASELIISRGVKCGKEKREGGKNFSRRDIDT